MQVSKDKWFVTPKPRPQAKMRLFCFPYSGSGAFAYHSWADQVPPQVELCAVQLPGRENRLKEAVYTQLSPLIEAIMTYIPPYLDKPIALFGHSLGAIIAFELARTLRQEHQITPQHLFASARVAPQVPERQAPLYALPDDEFIEALRGFEGTPDDVLDNQELMAMLLPMLKADFEINETYVYREDEPLDCPISAFRGAKDAIMTYEEVAAWAEQTTKTFTLRTLPGGHFFINGTQNTFWQIFTYDLRQAVSRLR